MAGSLELVMWSLIVWMLSGYERALDWLDTLESLDEDKPERW